MQPHQKWGGIDKWTLIDTSTSADISFSGIPFKELLIVVRGVDSSNAQVSLNFRVSKEEIETNGTNSVWYTQGGYYSASLTSFANCSLNGSTKVVHPNVFIVNGTPVSNKIWYLYYK